MDDNNGFTISFDAIKKGEKKAFENLYIKFYGKLYAFLLGYTEEAEIIEDVIQEVFLKIWKQREKITITTSLNSYIFRTAYNTLMSNYRNLKKNNSMLESYYYTALIQATEIDEDYLNSQLTKLRDCIENLPSRSQEVFKKNKLEGMKYAEVAKKLDISIKTVEGHISRSLKYLVACMT